jgi:hypothetical protein
MDTSLLEEVGRLLSRCIVDKEARVSVAVETGCDESMLLGTTDGYLRFALAMIDFVRKSQCGEAQTSDLNGRMVPSRWLGDFCMNGEVRITSGWLAQNEAERQRLSDYFVWLSPSSQQSSTVGNPGS